MLFYYLSYVFLIYFTYNNIIFMINKIVLCLIFIIVVFIIYTNVKKTKSNNKSKKSKMKAKTKKSKIHPKIQPKIQPKILPKIQSKFQQKNESKKNKLKDKMEKINLKKSIIKKPKHVYLTIEINKENIGNIVIKLFDNIVPKTSNNFRVLCKTKKYYSSPFHRIIKDFMIQGGDFTQHNGRGGESIYGSKFEDENFILKHDRPYLLSMANSGPDTNGSQFFITTSPTPHLDGVHVVFGEVIEGFDIVYKLNNTDTENDDTPTDRIIITDCGEC